MLLGQWFRWLWPTFVFAFELMCTIYERVLLHCIVLQWHNGMTLRNYGVPKYGFLKISHQPSNVSNFQRQWQNRLQIWEIWIFFCIPAASILGDTKVKIHKDVAVLQSIVCMVHWILEVSFSTLWSDTATLLSNTATLQNSPSWLIAQRCITLQNV